MSERRSTPDTVGNGGPAPNRRTCFRVAILRPTYKFSEAITIASTCELSAVLRHDRLLRPVRFRCDVHSLAFGFASIHSLICSSSQPTAFGAPSTHGRVAAPAPRARSCGTDSALDASHPHLAPEIIHVALQLEHALDEAHDDGSQLLVFAARHIGSRAARVFSSFFGPSISHCPNGRGSPTISHARRSSKKGRHSL